MFIAVTPIGSSANDVSAAAKAYVDYLCGGGVGVADTAGYYAAGDTSMVLDGAVDGREAEPPISDCTAPSIATSSPRCSKVGITRRPSKAATQRRQREHSIGRYRLPEAH